MKCLWCDRGYTDKAQKISKQEAYMAENEKKLQECVNECLDLDHDMEIYQLKHFATILVGSAILIGSIMWVAPVWFETANDADSIARYLSFTTPRVIFGICAMILGTCLWDYVTPGHSVRTTLKDPKASAIVIAAMMAGIAYIVR